MPVSSSEIQHLPVLVEETLSYLRLAKRRIVVDATLGFGGHSLAILESFPNVRLVAFDQDATAITLAAQRLTAYRDRITFVHSNFAELKGELAKLSIESVDGIIADLGISSMQVDSETRGFSFRYDAPLDMRMDSSAFTETAEEILATRTETEIANLIFQLGEERFSRRIARRIVLERESGRPIKTTKQLADLVSRCVPRSKKDEIHPATRTFQALRIAVNNELEILDGFLRDAIDILTTNGILAVIAFHSLEDRIVKQTFQRMAGKCICPPRIPQCVCGSARRVAILTKKPVTASATEIEINPRSRSAKLRVIRKLEAE